MGLHRTTVTVAWVAAVVVLSGGVKVWKDAFTPVTWEEPSVLGRLSADNPGGDPRLLDPPLAGTTSGDLQNRNPFRGDRRPANAPFRLLADVVEPLEEPAAPRNIPGLRLVGVVGGPPWNALLQGVPGKEAGLVLELGESWNGFRFEKIRNDSVFLTGPDTTWVLVQSTPRE